MKQNLFVLTTCSTNLQRTTENQVLCVLEKLTLNEIPSLSKSEVICVTKRKMNILEYRL